MAATNATPEAQTVQTRSRNLAEYHERMFAVDVAAWLGIGTKRFYALNAHGEFLFAEHLPRIGRRSWSRDRLQAWHDGTLTGLTVARRRSG